MQMELFSLCLVILEASVSTVIHNVNNTLLIKDVEVRSQ